VSRLSRQCGILNISQPYRPPRPAKGMAVFFYFYNNNNKNNKEGEEEIVIVMVVVKALF
jgi:hypothetical protein